MPGMALGMWSRIGHETGDISDLQGLQWEEPGGEQDQEERSHHVGCGKTLQMCKKKNRGEGVGCWVGVWDLGSRY